MENSVELRQQLRYYVTELAKSIDGRGEDGKITFSRHLPNMELEAGESVTGYQYLHGANEDVGGFRMWGVAALEYGGLCGSDGADVPAVRVDLRLHFEWNDKIDPNTRYFSDTVKSAVAAVATLGEARPYIMTIGWEDTCSISLDASGSVTSATGYPFDDGDFPETTPQRNDENDDGSDIAQ
jgi:hypothetical protein